MLNGTTDYSLLHGDSGPLVYPAGHVWIFGLFYMAATFLAGDSNSLYRELAGDSNSLYRDTSDLEADNSLPGSTGTHVKAGQYTFLVVYLASVLMLVLIYGKSRRAPSWIVFLLLFSKRIHSIYLLRMFNDCSTYPALILILSIKFLKSPCSFCMPRCWYSLAFANHT